MSPDGDGTFTVPAATDCTDDGAICTHDDTMLSSQPVLTIRAPSQEAASNAWARLPSRASGVFLRVLDVGVLEAVRRGCGHCAFGLGRSQDAPSISSVMLLNAPAQAARSSLSAERPSTSGSSRVAAYAREAPAM